MRILLISLALCIIFVCASGGFAQTNKVPSIGGFKSVSVKDAKILEAADFAVAKQAEKNETNIELLSIEKAETQIVAGTNFRLCMQVTAFSDEEDLEEGEETEEVTGFVKVIVFRNLKEEFSLTSWTVVENCGMKTDKTTNYSH